MLAYEYGLQIIPARKAQLESFDALNLATSCGVTRPSESIQALDSIELTIPVTRPELTFHVCSVSGNDEQYEGTQANPLRTIIRALALTRSMCEHLNTIEQCPQGTPKNIILAKGMHYLNETIALGVADSGLTITAAPGVRCLSMHFFCQHLFLSDA